MEPDDRRDVCGLEPARQLGDGFDVERAVLGHLDDYPEVYSVAKNRLANENRKVQMVTPWTGWHADITAAVNPPMASILRGVTIPPYGGDTFWTNLNAAYMALSPTMRAFCRRAARHPPIRQSR